MVRLQRLNVLLREIVVAGVMLVFLSLQPQAHAVTIDWVTVGDVGNAADPAAQQVGSVGVEYQIMKYEFSNAQYTSFLNSVAKVDTYALYNTNMGSSARGGITRSGSNGSYTYSVKDNMGDKPVNFVSWFDAARVANWLHNGQGVVSTETGAYTLNGATNGIAPAANADALFYIPNQDLWHKAAYYKGGGASSGYWRYATQSDASPTAVSAGSTGIGSAGGAGNFVNYAYGADWNGIDGNLTTVGTNGGPSAYGAFDMNGNVWEWNDLNSGAGTARILRGGGWDGDLGALSSSFGLIYNASEEFNVLGNVGFRLARPSSGPSPIPEIDPAGIGSMLALVTGSLGLLERRRRSR